MMACNVPAVSISGGGKMEQTRSNEPV